MANIDASAFLDKLWRTTDGYVRVAAGLKSKNFWKESAFKWPDDRAKVLEVVRNIDEAGYNVYVGVALYKTPDKKKHNILGTHYAFAEYDKGLAPSTWGEYEPTIVMQSSGPGNQHCFWELTNFTNDVNLIEAVNQRLAGSSADKSGFDAGQVLRVPGTHNYKYPEAPVVQVIRPLGTRRFDATTIAYPTIADVMDWWETNKPAKGWTDGNNGRSEQWFGHAKDLARDGVAQTVAVALMFSISEKYLADHEPKFPLRHRTSSYASSSCRCVTCQVGRAYKLIEKEESELPTFDGLTGKKREVSKAKSGRLTLTKLSDLKNESQFWLMKDQIPLGEMTIVGGLPQAGKSTLVSHLIAEITNGTLDGDRKGEPGSVIVYATEESFTRTIRPRLDAAGANLELVMLVNEGIKLPKDAQRLADLLLEEKPLLFVFDPIASIMTKDSNAEDAVREVLEPLTKISHATGVTMLGIRHFKKEFTRDAGSVGGSIAWTAVPRSVIAVVRDEDCRVMGQLKSSLAPDSRPRTFNIEGKEVQVGDGQKPNNMGVVRWIGEDDRNMDAVMEQAYKRSRGTAPETITTGKTTAKTWLFAYMGEQPRGWAMARDIEAESPHKPGALNNAADAIGLRKFRLSVTKAPSVWFDPARITEDAAREQATNSYDPTRDRSSPFGPESEE